MNSFEISDAQNLIISPHLDDAVFSLGGLLALYPKESKVVTIFSGTPQKPISRHWDRVCGFKNSTEAVQKRIEENYNALSMIGIEKKNIINFHFLDKQYRGSFFKKAKFSNDLTDELVSKIKDVISAISGHVNIFVPLMDHHEDHKIVRDAVRGLYMNDQTLKQKINLYLYQDMPYFYTYYKKSKDKDFFKSKMKVISEILPTVSNYEIRVIELSEQNFKKKIDSEMEYKSQFVQKVFGFQNLDKQQTYISKTQAKIFESREPHCEIVYKI